MRRCFPPTGSLLALTLLGSVLLGSPGRAPAQESVAQKERSFQLTYAVQISGVPAGEKVRVWLPVPQTQAAQRVEVVSQELPGQPQTLTEPKYGNRMVYFEVPAPAQDSIAGSMTFRVRRSEVLGLPEEGRSDVEPLTAAQRRLFLSPDRKVPLSGRPLELIKDAELPSDPLLLARWFYDRVDEHVKYDKTNPGYGQGDVNWVCDSRTGNCTDFHSLFISWARAHGLPAQFEIGFPLPEQRGAGEIAGYHCWAFFYAHQQWIPVDISEADKNPALKEYYFGHLTENRVAFTRGRDLHLMPQQDAEPLNFFVYPHVEVGGKALPREQVKWKVTFRDE